MARPVGVLLLLGVVACGTAEPKPAGPPTGRELSAGTSLERYFPLEEGKLYHYVTKEGGETGMLVAKVHRADATHGELRLSNATKRFTFLPDGVAYEGGAYILKAPADVGTSWPGEHGGTTTIATTTADVTVPAGSYAGCLQTVEEGGRPPGARYETTYCPGVGMVLLVVRAGGSEARAELKSYGAPVKIE
ncbi:MAG: hypothetical protein KIS78_15760 [Labilithrix sp.]|nr:hypothetical protein [Labilithrix sp.]MCW5833857.1 hypothetical protein [Labilithrix sp.]